MSEPDTVKAGWSTASLWGLWYSFVVASVIASLLLAKKPWLAREAGGESRSSMTPLAHIRTTRIPRTILLVVGCVPMILVHGVISFLMIFPLVSLAAGNWLQGLLLLWWLFVTTGLAVLVYSCATFSSSSRRLPVWQVAGLLGGMVLTIPLVFGFAGEWWTAMSALLAFFTSAYILVNTSWNPERPVGDAPNPLSRVG